MTFASSIVTLIGGTSLLAKEFVTEGFKGPAKLDLIFQQVYEIGIKSLPLIIVTSSSIGMVMALQFGISLEKFGGTLYIPKIVSLSVIREFGPVFTFLSYNHVEGLRPKFGLRTSNDFFSSSLSSNKITFYVILNVRGISKVKNTSFLK